MARHFFRRASRGWADRQISGSDADLETSAAGEIERFDLNVSCNPGADGADTEAVLEA